MPVQKIEIIPKEHPEHLRLFRVVEKLSKCCRKSSQNQHKSKPETQGQVSCVPKFPWLSPCSPRLKGAKVEATSCQMTSFDQHKQWDSRPQQHPYYKITWKLTSRSQRASTNFSRTQNKSKHPDTSKPGKAAQPAQHSHHHTTILKSERVSPRVGESSLDWKLAAEGVAVMIRKRNNSNFGCDFTCVWQSEQICQQSNKATASNYYQRNRLHCK